jgi:hypothetical protein
MKKLSNRDRVDALVEQFWKRGYLTVSRRYGKYLPEPNPVGDYAVDAVAKYKRKVALGIILSTEELDDPQILLKLDYLATRQKKYSNRNITVFVGVPETAILKAKMIILSLDESIRKNIKLIGIPDTKD